MIHARIAYMYVSRDVSNIVIRHCHWLKYTADTGWDKKNISLVFLKYIHVWYYMYVIYNLTKSGSLAHDLARFVEK